MKFFLLPLRIAWRYLVGSPYEKNVSTMVKICFWGIMIGTFALALVMSIMHGFEQAIYQKMQGIHPQVMMSNGANMLDCSRIAAVLTREFPTVAAYSPQTTEHVIIQTDSNNDITNVLALRGIDATREQAVSTLHKKIINPAESTLANCIHDNHVLIGASCAQSLNVSVGDQIQLLFARKKGTRKRRVLFDNKTAVIGGIFKTGIDEFDQGVMFCSLDFFAQLFPNTGITQINFRLHEKSNEQAVIKKLKNRFHLDVYSWKDLYLPLVSALKLEKYAMFFILALIMLVACMNIISLLFMQITQKRGDIAMLKSMGMPDSQIRAIFFIMGTSVATIGTTIGLALAWFAGLLLQRYPLITLPDVYYVTHLPVTLDLRIFAAIFLLAIVMSIIATWLPLRNIKTSNIATMLRFEA